MRHNTNTPTTTVNTERSARRVSRFSFVGALLGMTLVAGCLNDSAVKRETPIGQVETGSANVTINLARVGALAKSADISMRMLYLSAHAADEDTVRDSVSLSGHAQYTVALQFLELAASKRWHLSATAVDVKGIVVYGDTASFVVTPGATHNVNLTLAARYSMLVANFYPIRDSVTSVALYVGEELAADSSFPKHALRGDTVALAYGYLPASPSGTSVAVQLDARGDYFGQPNTLLYRGVGTFFVRSGKDTAYNLTMQWAHPSPPPPGQANIQVTLGAIGRAIINGGLEDTVPPPVYAWQTVGGVGVSGASTLYNSMALDASGRPFVAYRDQGIGGKLTVLHWNGSVWSSLGGPGVSVGAVSDLSLALNASGHPVVAYIDEANGRKVTVLRWDGTAWSPVGGVGISAGQAAFISLALDSSGHPVVAYQDMSATFKLTVLRWDGIAWSPVGGVGVSESGASQISLALNSLDNPIVAYLDLANGDKLTVLRWDGSAWAPMGGAGVSAGAISQPYLALDEIGNPGVAYRDDSNDGILTVTRWNGSAWVNLGGIGVSAGSIFNPSLALDNLGNPVVAYRDVANADKLTVHQWDGSAWSPVGGVGVSAGRADHLSLAIDESGNLFVAYQDGANGFKLTVLRYAPVQ